MRAKGIDILVMIERMYSKAFAADRFFKVAVELP